MKRRDPLLLKLPLSLASILLLGGCQLLIGQRDKDAAPAQPNAQAGSSAGGFGADTSDAGATSSSGAGGSQAGESGATANGGSTQTAGAAGGLGKLGGAGGTGEVEDIPDDLQLLDYRLAVGQRHVCAIRSSGKVFCFGENESGQRGNDEFPDTARENLLVWTRTLRNNERPYWAEGLRAGTNTTCGTSRGQVWCWGANDVGQTGRGERHPGHETLAVLVPLDYTLVDGEADTPDIVMGGDHACADDFDRWCWGSNRYGEINPQSTKQAFVPSVTAYEHDIVALSLGDGFSLGLVGRGGGVYCWGRNSYDQCGPATSKCEDGTPCVLEARPVPDTGFSQAIFAGQEHACSILAVGSVECWGHNDQGQSAPDDACAKAGKCSVGPTEIALPVEPSLLALGEHHTCALASDRVLCWGERSALGRGAANDQSTPGYVLRTDGSELEGVIDLAARGTMTCAMTEPDEVWCWGTGPGGVRWPSATHIAW